LPLQVAAVLLEVGEPKPDGIPVDRELGGDALRDRKLEMREQVGGDELVLGRVLAGRERLTKQPLRLRRLAGQHHQAGEAVGGQAKVGMLDTDLPHRLHILGFDRFVELLLTLGREQPGLLRRRRRDLLCGSSRAGAASRSAASDALLVVDARDDAGACRDRATARGVDRVAPSSACAAVRYSASSAASMPSDLRYRCRRRHSKRKERRSTDQVETSSLSGRWAPRHPSPPPPFRKRSRFYPLDQTRE